MSINKLKELSSELSSERQYRVAGIITSITKIITKSRETMIFAKIEDMSDNLEVIVFPGKLKEKPEIWQENSIIIVQGRISKRDAEPKIICEEVVRIN